MTTRILTLLVLLLAPAPETESVRLKRLFEEHWATRLRESPEFATYFGHPNDRWSDLSPESFARAYEIAREELAALAAIDRSRLNASEQVDYDLLRRRLERQIEGRRFHDLGSYLLIDQIGGIDLDLVQLLDYMPARTVEEHEAMLARLRGFPKVVDQTLALLAKGLEAGITPPRVTCARRSTDFPKTIPAADRERLRAEADRIFAGQVEPTPPGARTRSKTRSTASSSTRERCRSTRSVS